MLDPKLTKDPNEGLDFTERAALVSILDMPGWFALQKLMLLEIHRFDLALKNADAANEKSVLAAHVISKAASQFYVQIISRLNKEREMFQGAYVENEILPSIADQITEVE